MELKKIKTTINEYELASLITFNIGNLHGIMQQIVAGQEVNPEHITSLSSRTHDLSKRLSAALKPTDDSQGAAETNGEEEAATAQEAVTETAAPAPQPNAVEGWR